jgi:hypothetical protein
VTRSLRLRMLGRTVLTTAGALVTGAARAVMHRGAQPRVMLQRGDAAPLFELQGSDGRVHRLHDQRGHIVVLAWFPKAFTGG